MKTYKYFNVLTLVFIAINLVACNKPSEKLINNDLLDSLIKKPAVTYWDLSGKVMSGDSCTCYGFENTDQFHNRADMPEAARKAGINNVAINVKYIISPEGKIVWAKAVNGKILRKDFANKIGFGIEEKAESLFKVGTQLKQYNKNKNLKPCYQVDLQRVHFGDLSIWQAVEECGTTAIKVPNTTNVVDFETKTISSFFEKNLLYPREEIAKQISGAVFVSFYVSPDHTIFEPNIVKGINPAFDAEAKRLLDLLVKSEILKDEPTNKKHTNNKEECYKVTMPILFELK